MQSGPKKVLADVSMPWRAKNCKHARVGFQFVFPNPEKGEDQLAGWYIDTSMSITKQDLMNLISNSIAEWLFKYYEFRNLSFLKSKKFKDSMKVINLECI